MTYNYIDLFCGCGGFTLGFQKAGLNPLLGIDLWADATTTYQYNFSNAKVINKDITTVSADEIKETVNQKKVDIIIGGPPCQGFSISGKRMIDDPRNILYKSFVEMVGAIRPSVFVMENVPGLVSMAQGAIKDSVIEDFSSRGYNVTWKILSADDYGVPQHRRRVFFVGLNKDIFKDKKFVFPEPTTASNKVTCKDAISDLDFISDEVALPDETSYLLDPLTDYQRRMRVGSTVLWNHVATIHNAKTKEIISMVPDGGNYEDLPKELWSTRKVHIAWTRMDSTKPCFILKLLKIAQNDGRKISINALGYYVLNALDVLRGIATVEEVYHQIKKDEDAGIIRRIIVPGKASSFTMQHIREQLNYLELANLVFIDDEKNVILNTKEERCIDYFISNCGVTPMFDVYSYSLSKIEDREKFYYAWDAYYGKISPNAEIFDTKVEALFVKETQEEPEDETQGSNTVELGDEGELYVLNKEKARVRSFNPRLVNKVLPLGRTKGLGYDIQSVIAERGEMAEFVKYIEVKSTKRVTAPDLKDDSWIDTINITRNEWVAAVQHKEFYSIYRVYFVRDGVIAYIINNVYKKESDGLIQVTPMMYRVDFTNAAIDAVLE